MFGVLNNIFGSGDVVKKGLDLIDEAWTSDEEKAENEAPPKLNYNTENHEDLNGGDINENHDGQGDRLHGNRPRMARHCTERRTISESACSTS